VSVTYSGPVFDGRADVLLRRACEDVTEQVAAFASEAWHRNLDTSLRHPTPYYETQLRTTNMGLEARLDDRGIIYGPWLEGTGSRNRTTRFKGYASARRAYQSTEQAAELVAERAVRRYVPGMNA